MKGEATQEDPRWLLSERPRIEQSGRFPHDDRGFSRRYFGQPTLHCYEYAGVIRIGGREFSFEPGDVTFTPDGVSSSYDLREPGHHLCIHFSAGDLQSGAPSCQVPLHLSAELARVDGVSFAEAMLRVMRLHAIGEVDAVAAEAASVGLQRLLLALGLARGQMGQQAPRGRADRDPVEHAAILLRRGVSEPLDVPWVARSVGLSQNYLARRFKQRFGVTMPRYHLRHRMEYAALLLSTTNLPVGLVAARVGMPDPQHFNKQFRAFHGQSPSAARHKTE